MNQAPPENCPQAVFDAVLDTPEPDKWIDCGEVRPRPMFHMHTMMKYGEKCAFTAVTHGVKMEWQPIETAPKDGTSVLIYKPKALRKQVEEAYWVTPWEDAPDEQCHWSTPIGIAGRGYTILPSSVTHWMPLPQPPGEQA